MAYLTVKKGEFQPLTSAVQFNLPQLILICWMFLILIQLMQS